MRCPKCSHTDDKVIDSRTVRNGDVIRRRRVCLECGHRFTTYEEVIKSALRVIKRDGRHEDLDRNKMLAGVTRACEKRPISSIQIETLIDTVLNEIDTEFERKCPRRSLAKSDG
jgi:transcriptional repressor NrdR